MLYHLLAPKLRLRPLQQLHHGGGAPWPARISHAVSDTSNLYQQLDNLHDAKTGSLESFSPPSITPNASVFSISWQDKPLH